MSMRPFSHLGDQQLLAQTQRLARNGRCLEVHILDHLGEIDRRGLALRRGFSSLFDYAVRELRFSDAAAQRRIQALRLCRRHGWVRDKLQNGALTLTAAAQLETAIAGAERHGKQEVARRGGAQPAGNGRPPGGRGLVGGGQNVPAGIAGAAPAAATGAATAGIADAAPAATGVAAAGMAGAAPAAVTSAAAGEPVAAPGAAAACAQPGARAAAAAAAPPAVAGDAPPRAQCRGDVVAIDQPRPLPAAPSGAVPPRPDHPGAVPLQPPPAPLRDPQRQRALIEQAAGLSTRQVAGLIAAAAPELPLRRDTLRALGAGTFSLTITIDQECQRGLHLLKGLLAHRDPRMSWSDLVARLVREAVDRHDPSRGGRGQRRRQSASSASEAPAGTPAARRCAGAARTHGRPRAAPLRRRSARPAPPLSAVTRCRSRSVKCRRVRQPPSRRRRAGHLPATVRGWRPRPPLLRCRTRRPARPLATIPCRRLQRPRPPALRRRSRRPTHHLPAAAPVRLPVPRRVPAVAHGPLLPGAPFPPPSGVWCGSAIRDAAAIVIRSPAGAVPPPICCSSTTCCRSLRAAARTRKISAWSALRTTASGTGAYRLRNRRARCRALPRRRGGTADRRLMDGRTAPAPPSAQHSGRIAGCPLSCHKMGSHPRASPVPARLRRQRPWRFGDATSASG